MAVKFSGWGEPGRPRSHERGYGERRSGYGVGQAAALGRFRSDGRKTIGGLLMDEGFLANPTRVSRGNWVIGYWLFGGGAHSHLRSSISDPPSPSRSLRLGGGNLAGSARALACRFRRPRRKPGHHGRGSLFAEWIIARPAGPPDRGGALRNTRGRVCSPSLLHLRSTIHDLRFSIPLGGLGVLAVKFSGWGELDPR